ncbi:MAG TPA: transferrin receptor-like dimerization domain-containing protein [Gemmatimonadales bacterium]
MKLPAAVLVSTALLAWSAQEPAPIRGFASGRVAAQHDLERRFRELPSPDSLRSYMRHLTARPHHVGSPYGRELAMWMLERFRAWGLEARIDTFEVLFPTPVERVVELVAPTRFRAGLSEPALAADPTSGQTREQLPSYNAYSADGDVTAELVYVNYGVPADYEQLERMGISVAGKIVIARYGGSWRGIKPKVAAEHGAVGCIIYSDPRDDGYYQGEVYPEGAWRPKDGVQRGSVVDMPLYPGDPLTPGVGAWKGARRLSREEAPSLVKIPVLPMGYGDAQPLLAAIRGPVAPESWRGALPLTYRIGPGPATVRLRLRFDWSLRPAYNVIGVLPGREAPDQWIVRGNHHDAWVNGAEDPISGLIALLEEARALGALRQQGWQPRRTIVYAAWDAEEPGLLGSTEWAEAHAEELRRKAVAYLNTDASGRGFLYAAGSHSLERFVNEVAKEIPDPETGLTVWRRAQMQMVGSTSNPSERAERRTATTLPIEALGSGSDYTPFLQHLGIASLHLGFGGLDGGGIYHSIYDDFRWFTRFSDTSFAYGRALAQTTGTAVLRLAEADLLPYEFTGLAKTVARYAKEVQDLLASRRDEAVERNQRLDEGLYAATDDPRRRLRPPARKQPPPHLNFAPLMNGLEALRQAAERYERAQTGALQGGIEPATAARVNGLLIRSERALASADGLPGRPWFQHSLYAPGFYTGYGVKTLPGVREGIEQDRWPEAEAQILRLEQRLGAAAAVVDSAAVLLGSKD